MFIGLFSTTVCKPEKEKTFTVTPYDLKIPSFFLAKPNNPEDNSMTEEDVALGRLLFYDDRLSGRTKSDSIMYCAICHRQKIIFEANTDHPVFKGDAVHGITGIEPHHIMPSLFNLVWNSNGHGRNASVFMENKNVKQRTLENVVWNAAMAHDEIAGNTTRIDKLFQNTNRYPKLFEKAFGPNTTVFRNIEKALAQFIKSPTSYDIKFDHCWNGKTQLSHEELHGHILFVTEDGADCFHCQEVSNPLFTLYLCHDNELDSVFHDAADYSAVTGNHNDKYWCPVKLSSPI